MEWCKKIPEEEEVDNRWREYFGQLLNREVIRGVGDDNGKGTDRVNKRRDRRELEKEKVLGVLKKMKQDLIWMEL